MNAPTPQGLFGYPGQPSHYTLADGRTITAGELVARALAKVYPREFTEDALATPEEWNAESDDQRRGFCERALEDWNAELEGGAAAVDAGLAAAIVAEGTELLGDALIDAALTEVKALARPWQQMTEDQQREVLERITAQVRAATADTIRLLQTQGRAHIVCELESITVKKGAKATLDVPKGELDQDLLDAVGQSVILVVGPALSAAKDIQAPKPDPDQRSLLDSRAQSGDNGLVQHSDPED